MAAGLSGTGWRRCGSGCICSGLVGRRHVSPVTQIIALVRGSRASGDPRPVTVLTHPASGPKGVGSEVTLQCDMSEYHTDSLWSPYAISLSVFQALSRSALPELSSFTQPTRTSLSHSDCLSYQDPPRTLGIACHPPAVCSRAPRNLSETRVHTCPRDGRRPARPCSLFLLSSGEYHVRTGEREACGEP